jgi:TatD DNase family protein
MIDTHCHLTDPRLGQQLDGVLQRAATAGVHRMITIGTGLEDSAEAAAVCRDRPSLRCAVGVHPNYSQDVTLDELPQLRGLAAHPSVVALGEMGLDYHYDTPKAHQAAVFETQLQLAAELNKPVVIHCREAMDDCLAIMKQFPAIPADFHCFTGTPDEARRVLDAGYLIGLTGVVTFKNSPHLRDIARFIPADRLLVETDAPYLSPEPMRKQKVNEPAFVVHVAARIAQERNVSIEEIDRLTTENALRFFRWNPSSL